MKTILTALFLSPLLSFAQKKPLSFYADPAVFVKRGVNYDGGGYGGSFTAGARISNLGIGAGVEASTIYTNLNTAFPVFADLRYFFGHAKHGGKMPLAAFIAADFGKLVWNASYDNGVPSDNNTFHYKGKTFFSIEPGIRFGVKPDKGFQLSLAFRAINFSTYTTHRTTRDNTGGTIPLQTTTTGPVNITNMEVALKIGYQF